MKFNLNQGDTIGICSPSGPYTEKEINPAINYLNSLGFKIKLAKNIFSRDRYLAGSPKERADDFHQLISDNHIDGILAGRGGFGSMQILDLLDFSLIKKNKKPIYGFSDTTALQLGILKKANLPTITGISLSTDIKIKSTNKNTLKNFENIIFQQVFPKVVLNNETKSKNSSGILIGGCLTLIVSLLGSSYLPPLKNKILFIEDVTEEPYHVDRLLSQLLLAKEFSTLSAIIIGKFYKCKAENKKHGTINQVINSFIKRCPVPIYSGLPYGHQPSRILLPIGSRCTIKNNSLTLHAT